MTQTDDTSSPRGRARSETLAIPQAMRDAVDERDGRHCRVCGRYLGEERALHHIVYGFGVGARRQHAVDNLVTVCWMWGRSCHDRVHANKHRFQPVLFEVIKTPGLTALQLLRWQEARR